MKLFEEEKIVAENEVCKFAISNWTIDAENYAKKEYDLDIKCLIAIQKSCPDDKEYVLVFDGEFVYGNTSYEAIAVHIDMLALQKGKVKFKGAVAHVVEEHLSGTQKAPGSMPGGSTN